MFRNEVDKITDREFEKILEQALVKATHIEYPLTLESERQNSNKLRKKDINRILYKPSNHRKHLIPLIKKHNQHH